MTLEMEIHADGSDRTSCQAQREPRVAFPGLSVQAPNPSVAGLFLPLTDMGCWEGTWCRASLEEN